MTLFLTETQVEQILTMPDAMRVIEDALRSMGRGNAINRPRQRIRTQDGVLNVMPAALPTRGYLGLKYYTSFQSKTRFWFHLLDGKTGDLLAVMQADRLGQQRTGAASGVATKYLARADACTVGLIGSGWQAESQLQAMCIAREISSVKCYSRDMFNRNLFAKKMQVQLRVEIQAVETAEEAVRGSDIIVAATNSREPVLLGEWLVPGTHVNAMGANRAEAHELDEEVVRRSKFICVDSIEQAKNEAADLIGPIERGYTFWPCVRELGELVAGKTTGRVDRDDITLFKSLGIAVEDVAVGAWVYERARENKLGSEIDL
jgi:alanine dehydrogenase